MNKQYKNKKIILIGLIMCASAPLDATLANPRLGSALDVMDLSAPASANPSATDIKANKGALIQSIFNPVGGCPIQALGNAMNARFSNGKDKILGVNSDVINALSVGGALLGLEEGQSVKYITPEALALRGENLASSAKPGDTVIFDKSLFNVPTGDTTVVLKTALNNTAFITNTGKTKYAITNSHELLGLLKYSKDGVIIDTGIKAYTKRGADSIYSALKLLCTQSDKLDETLYGRVIALSGLMNSVDVSIPTLYTATDSSDGDVAKKILSRIEATNKNFENNPRFIDHNTMSPDDIKAYNSSDTLSQDYMQARTVGIVRDVQYVHASNYKPLFGQYIIDVIPELFDYNDYLKKIDSNSSLVLASGSSTEPSLTEYMSAEQYMGANAAIIANDDKSTALTKINAALAKATEESRRGLVYALNMYKLLVQNAGTSETNFTIDTFLVNNDNKAKLLKTAYELGKKFDGNEPRMNVSSAWNAKLLDAGKTLLEDTQLALYLPGKKIDGTDEYEVDLARAIEGSTFSFATHTGTNANANAYNNTAHMAMLMIIDTVCMFDDAFYTFVNEKLKVELSSLGVDFIKTITVNGKTRKVFDYSKMFIKDSSQSYGMQVLLNKLQFETGETNYKNIKNLLQADTAVKISKMCWQDNTSKATDDVTQPTVQQWKHTPFLMAIDSLRYAYDAHQLRFREIHNQTNPAWGSTFTTTTTLDPQYKPNSYLDLFGYGGKQVMGSDRTIANVTITSTGTSPAQAWFFGSIEAEDNAKNLQVIPTGGGAAALKPMIQFALCPTSIVNANGTNAAWYNDVTKDGVTYSAIHTSKLLDEALNRSSSDDTKTLVAAQYKKIMEQISTGDMSAVFTLLLFTLDQTV